MGRLTRTSASEKYEIIRLVEESALPVKQTLAEIGLPGSCGGDPANAPLYFPRPVGRLAGRTSSRLSGGDQADG